MSALEHSWRITAKPEVNPGQKSGCGKLRCLSPIAAGFGKITARSKPKAVENHVLVGKSKRHKPTQTNQQLANQLRRRFLGSLETRCLG
jgi:hypothetical protein